MKRIISDKPYSDFAAAFYCCHLRLPIFYHRISASGCIWLLDCFFAAPDCNLNLLYHQKEMDSHFGEPVPADSLLFKSDDSALQCIKKRGQMTAFFFSYLSRIICP